MNAFGFPWCPFGRAPDVELMENEFPILIPLSQHWMDSCGAGKHRGGVGTVQPWVAHQAPMVLLMCIADNSQAADAAAAVRRLRAVHGAGDRHPRARADGAR